ncbi:hypothetical protein [Halobellus ordinarius]|uniref:hypothetical protein n=1 Tax=Halobellus ordinarius TaxID=3075120 RepID=UPI0028809FED|nr:hypothetical protein [Halobellus sp. ZY16]
MTTSKEELRERLAGLTEELVGVVELDQRQKRAVRISELREPDEPNYNIDRLGLWKPEFDLGELRNRDEIINIANWLYEEGRGYRPCTDDLPSDSEVSYLPYPEEDNGTKRDEIVDAYVEDIAKFVNKVIAYIGPCDKPITEYSEPRDAFESAFSEFFDWRYEEKLETEIVIPLLNFEGDFDSVELSTNVEFFKKKSHKPENIADHLLSEEEKIEDLEISRMTEAELGGVFSNKPRSHWFPFPSHKIRFRLTGLGAHPGAVQDIAQSIVTAIRLVQPEGNLGVDDGYKLERDWKFYRTGIYDQTVTYSCRSLPEPLTYSAYSQSQKSGPIRGLFEKIEFSEDDAQKFKEFWGEYSALISSAQREGKFEIPLHRFNLIYERNRIDDQIIDSIITAESTLGRDVNSNERVIFASRAAYLLRGSHNPSYVYNLLDTIYNARVDVVHRGEEVGSRTVEYVGEGSVEEVELEGRELIEESCDILSSVIREYLSRYVGGQNITETNRDELNEEMTNFLTQNPSVLAHLLDNSLSIGSLVNRDES